MAASSRICGTFVCYTFLPLNDRLGHELPAEPEAQEGTAEDKRLKAIGEEAIKQIKIVELIATAIENGKIKIVPDVLVSGGGTAGDGLMGQLARLPPGGGSECHAEEAGSYAGDKGVGDLFHLGE